MAPSPHESGSERTITTPSVSSSSSSKSLDGLSSEQAKKDGDSEHTHLPQPEKDVETAAAASSVHSPSCIVGWSGQGDQQNPQNFTVVQKVSISLVISLMNLTVSLAVSVFSAMLEVVAAEFKQDRPEKMESTLTAYILGLAFGPVLFGPASEYYGRKRPLILGVGGFVLFCTFTTYVSNVQALLLCRFLAAACGSAAYVIPPGIFVDLYGPVGRAVGYQIFATAAFIGGSLGPAVAACMIYHGINWRWTLYLVNGITFPLIVAMLFLPETLGPCILQTKARQLRLTTGDWSLHTRQEESAVNFSKYLAKPWKMLVQEPVLIVVTTAFTIDYAVFSETYSWVPFAFSMRGWKPLYAYSALLLTIPGFILGCAIVVIDTKTRFQRHFKKALITAPESRLPPLVAGMALLSIGLLTFAWTCARHIPWQIQGFSEVLFGCGMYLVWVTATVYIQDLYVSHSNSALAACSFVRYTIGAAAPMLSSLLRRKLGLPWAVSALGITCAVLVPAHMLLYFFGRKVRAWSKFALHDTYSADADEPRL
ncbi:MFS general substrate transporter [Sphaerulina musiva SO2202]|uniref:MFS general substrate transporter n=1 Tax=Sphaerulina musiva (strain SO2202) TaxID=692275 RepID=M3DD01_SPHMS|nr:MFS general substrate transporter [Sphaerulina musiva SO2202]EMF15694.1 MFS general substrate transporter [Sphaerulina musiva SO2202]